MRADWQTFMKCVFRHESLALLSFATPTVCFLLFAVKAYLLPSRRSLWAVLRIEHEQVANASGFRAFIWAPGVDGLPNGAIKITSNVKKASF